MMWLLLAMFFNLDILVAKAVEQLLQQAGWKLRALLILIPFSLVMMIYPDPQFELNDATRGRKATVIDRILHNIHSIGTTTVNTLDSWMTGWGTRRTFKVVGTRECTNTKSNGQKEMKKDLFGEWMVHLHVTNADQNLLF